MYTAFSGTHQDAISKGFAHHERTGSPTWEVPYLPIDPADVGRGYEAVIRVNSQSGKGGIAHLLHSTHGVDLPGRMRADFSRTVQGATDESGEEATGKDLWELFTATYLTPGRDGRLALEEWTTRPTEGGEHRFVCTLRTECGGGERTGDFEGTGNGPLSAFVRALAGAGHEVEILDFTQHATSGGQDSPAMAYAECRVGGRVVWGAGRDTSVLTASVLAVLSAVNRAG